MVLLRMRGNKNHDRVRMCYMHRVHREGEGRREWGASKCGALYRKRRRRRLMLDASLVECAPNVWRALLLKYKTANITVKTVEFISKCKGRIVIHLKPQICFPTLPLEHE